MPTGKQKKIVRLLGIGFDADDDHVRITKGENFDVLMGSDESHEYISELIQDIEREIKERGLALDDLSPEQLSELVKSIK